MVISMGLYEEFPDLGSWCEERGAEGYCAGLWIGAFPCRTRRLTFDECQNIIEV